MRKKSFDFSLKIISKRQKNQFEIKTTKSYIKYFIEIKG
jgi:hypothetical protein